MRTGLNRLLGIVLLAMLAVTITAGDGYGIWRSMLVEYFDKDQSDRPVQQWPWQTPLQNVNQRWHYNPWPPWYRFEPVRTDFTWGIQNFIYNSYIRQREEFPQSIWCAYTNRGDTEHPRWPEDDLYEHNQNAWAWWGPFNLRNAINAGVSFWYYVDVQYGSRDSLCVVVSNTAQNMTLNGNDFRTTLAFGTFTMPDSNRVFLSTFPYDSRDWQRREFYLDSLRLLNAQGRIVDTVSYIGEASCWLAFVWQSNERVIDANNGRGAFIDDVMVIWDDGLFEIQPDFMQFGYPVDEENIDWKTDSPGNNDHAYFRLRWRADGVGECGPFNVACYLDDQLIYEEQRTVALSNDVDTVFTTTADTLWEVVAGEHTVRWELDTPIDDGGQIEESDENNNWVERTFNVEWNPPPQFSIWTPEDDSTRVPVTERFPIEFGISDSNETDMTFTIFLFWTQDISGLEENPNVIYDYHYITHTFNATARDTVLYWNLEDAYLAGEIDTSMLVYICGFAADGFPGNQTIAIAPGRAWTFLPNAVPRERETPKPVAFGLDKAYPNPFNSNLMIDYSLLSAGKTTLAIFDITGRHVQTLIDGKQEAGVHTVNWSPAGISAGVYLLRLESEGQVSLQKAIYTP